MRKKFPNGNIASNDTENIYVLAPHFHQIYNTKRHVDISVLDQIPQRNIVSNIDHPITRDEVDIAIKKVVKNKSPGLNDVTHEAFKSLSVVNKKNFIDFLLLNGPTRSTLSNGMKGK